MSIPDTRTLHPGSSLEGTVRVPGDKSISHRAAMLGGLAAGTTTITGFLDSEDCLNTLGAMRTLGAVVERSGTTIRITGTGGRYKRPGTVLDMGNSGTGIRLLTGLLAGHAFESELTGDESLRSRPMGRIKEPLEKMGAVVELTGPRGCAPIRVRGGRLKGIEYALPMASAQVKSAVLLAGLFGDGVTRVIEPKPTRDHTERILRGLGVAVDTQGPVVSLKGFGAAGPKLPAGRWVVPGDFSSAAFWIAGACLFEGCKVVVEDVGLNPRRTAFIDVVKRMGAMVEVKEQAGAGEPMGRVTATGCSLKGTVVSGGEIPNLIDELPLVAVLGALAEGKTIVRDAAELRVKESDRVATIAAGLRAFGAAVEEQKDGFTVTGPANLAGGTVNSRGDHRIAMAMSLLALRARGDSRIEGTACIATSYPAFWDHFRQLAGQDGLA